MADTEKLARAVFSRVMAHWNLCHAESCDIELARHFHTNHSAARFQSDLFKNPSAEQAEVTIDIPDREPENKPHRPAIHFPNQDPVPGVGAFDFESVDQIDLRLKLGNQIVDF